MIRTRVSQPANEPGLAGCFASQAAALRRRRFTSPPDAALTSQTTSVNFLKSWPKTTPPTAPSASVDVPQSPRARRQQLSARLRTLETILLPRGDEAAPRAAKTRARRAPQLRALASEVALPRMPPRSLPPRNLLKMQSKFSVVGGTITPPVTGLLLKGNKQQNIKH
ncbi:uncharacterized protein LOC122257877 isoform X1 [Penaeus japonicus]|uniref:uncharacterized protein LOC122257877 isoform X1 n=1 Tax=Penaeus japonicus TaxID=27405 RepID=UPI001C717295|nr:uncharacterized protein LOC122257877 isoform X1 [Penaeus japonicus]